MRELGAEWDEPDAEQPEMPEIGLPDEEITTWVDTTGFGGQKFDAAGLPASARPAGALLPLPAAPAPLRPEAQSAARAAVRA
ncbi:hypothetical protein GCM10009639_19520 [Kitasatospora putterlickiae]|uniref:Uncharacterized protein n=1 Tax=Kitasatospora putterlickiae TaxID=221725 RepID=A0ABN1XV55_9ACTN